MNAHFSIAAALDACPPGLIPESPQYHARYNGATDVLTVMVGSQDRWVTRRVDTGQSTAWLDRDDAVVRVEYRQAHRTFPHEWLRQQARTGARRKRLGFP
jgi:hypothetical protein